MKSEDNRVMHAHDRTGEPVKSSESTHIVKEQLVPVEHRDIASFNADNEFNRATDEENIDFNIPGVPLERPKVYVFSDSVLCLGEIHENPEYNKAWEQRIGWITSLQSYRDFDGINGEPTEFEWNIFPGFDKLQLCGTPENFTRTLGQN